MIQEYYNRILEILENLDYESREATNMARFLSEDLAKAELRGEKFPDINDIFSRLSSGEPWQYISGKAHFYGMDFIVNPHVLIPRMETEELVYQALKKIPVDRTVSVLDIGTGSGIIAITIAKHRPKARVTALDISDEALSVAKQNAEMLFVPNVDWKHLDFLDEKTWITLPDVDWVLSNPPYIPPEEKNVMSASTLAFEPSLALFTEHHAMEFYEKIARFVTCRNNSSGFLAEINEFRGKEVLEVFHLSGINNTQIIKDLQGKDRMVEGFYNS